MRSYTKTHSMPYTAQQLYDLVVDVESYPEFVPLCKSATIGEITELSDGTLQFDSLLIFRFRKFGIYEEFASNLTVNPREKSILSVSDGSPFKSFSAKWVFTDTGPRQADAAISVSYEFRSKALDLFVERVAAGIGINHVITAWKARARAVYGGSDDIAA